MYIFSYLFLLTEHSLNCLPFQSNRMLHEAKCQIALSRLQPLSQNIDFYLSLIHESPDICCSLLIYSMRRGTPKFQLWQAVTVLKAGKGSDRKGKVKCNLYMSFLTASPMVLYYKYFLSECKNHYFPL